MGGSEVWCNWWFSPCVSPTVRLVWLLIFRKVKREGGTACRLHLLAHITLDSCRDFIHQKIIAQKHFFKLANFFLHMLQTKAFYSYWAEPVIIKNLKRGLASLFQLQLKTGKVIEVKSALISLSLYLMWKVSNKSIMSGYRMMCLEGAQWSTGQSKVSWPEPSSWRRVRLKRKDSPRTAR